MITLTDMGLAAGTLKLFLTLMTACGLMTALLIAVFWLMKGCGLYGLAVRAGISNPWGGFVPFFDDYTVGRLADRRGGKGTARALLVLKILFAVALVAVGVSVLGGAVDLLFAADKVLADGKGAQAIAVLPAFSGAAVPLVLFAVVALIRKIVRLVCLYRVYRRFSPSQAAVLTVFSFFSFLIPIFLFAIRKSGSDGTGE